MNSLYTKLVSNFLFPLHEMLKKHDSVRIKKQLEKSQWFSREEIETNQLKRLKAFLNKAYQNVPYVKEMFQSLGLTPSDIKSLNDLAKLPFMTKEVIQKNFDALKSLHSGPVAKGNTGGSSGQPLIFMIGKERLSHDVAEKWRATRWWDVDIGDKEIVAWGSPIELGSQDKVKLYRDKLFRSELIPAFDMTEEKLLGFIEKIKSMKPKMLFGYPSVYHLIAKTAESHHIDMTGLGIKVVFVTSERLYPYQREAIEKAFGCKVANGYGGRDAGFIAHECPGGNMHISAEDIVVEIIGNNGEVLPDGEQGEIVVTQLSTGDFPFIRYRTGDVATISEKKCSCGRGLPILENIQGRTTDFVVAADGTMMHGLALIYVLRELKGIESFKIVQETLEHTRVLVIKNDNISASSLSSQIVEGFKKRLGNSVQVDVEFVKKIDAEKSGKFRYVISKVAA